MFLGSGAVALGAGAALYAGLHGMGTMASYDAETAATRAPLSQTPEARDLIRYATLAANGHNTQQWKFRVAENRIDILPDFSRRTPAVDPDDHDLFASLGCAAENLAIAAGARGRASALAFDPAGEGSVQVGFANGHSRDAALFDAIPKRQSTRADYDGKPVAASDLGMLEATARVPGVDLILITDRPRIDQLRDLVLAGNSAQLADPAFVRELKSWLRFSPNEAMRTGDGLFSAASGSAALPAWQPGRRPDLVMRFGHGPTLPSSARRPVASVMIT